MASVSTSTNPPSTPINSSSCCGGGRIGVVGVGVTLPVSSGSSAAAAAGCQRLRLPSLVSVMRSSRASDYAAGQHSSAASACAQIRKEQRRVVVMGSARVGKTCIVSQFLYDKFLPRYKQTVEELHRGEYDLPDGSALTLDILDTSGAFEFPAMRTLSISTAGAFILVYAVDDMESWNEVERLRSEVSKCSGVKKWVHSVRL